MVGIIGVSTNTTTAGAAPLLDALLRVTTDPVVNSRILVDGAPGDHEVCWSPVSGMIEPGCRTVTVPVGGTPTVIGSFTPYAAATSGMTPVARSVTR